MSNKDNLKVEKNKENSNEIIEKLLKNEQQHFPGEKIKIIEIKSGIYSVEFDNGNISFFLDNNGEVLYSSGGLLTLPGYTQKLEQLGYKEEKIGTEYIMTRINDNSKVDKYSIEYYNIFVDLDFEFSLKYVSEALNSKKRLSRSQALELIPTFISAGSLTIGELESFMERGSITKEDFENFLAKMKVLLKEQTIDKRGNMKKFGKEVGEEEIKEYFEKGYINKTEALELYEIIQKREEKQQEKNNILKISQSSLEGEKNEYKV